MAVEGFFAGEAFTGFEGFEAFTGAFLAGAVFFGAGFAGFFTAFGAVLGAGFFAAGFGGAFLAAGFLARAGFLGAEDFLAGFDWEAERGELLEEVDLVFKLLSLRSFTLGQKGDEDRLFEWLGQGFVFGFFDALRARDSNRPHGF